MNPRYSIFPELKASVKELGYEGVDWIHLAGDRGQ
jgi:hypothetical protein